MVKTRIAKVCQLLNKHRAKYLVVGGEACILYGLTRTTEDIDIFVEKKIDNIERVLSALSELPYGIAKEILSEKVLNSPFNIIGDQPRVDVLTALAGVSFREAWNSRKTMIIEGVKIPCLNINLLIKTKDTDRLQDQADKEQLERLNKIRND